MDNALLVRVLDGLADGDEQFQPFARRKLVLVAIVGDGDAADEFHHEVGAACGRTRSAERGTRNNALRRCLLFAPRSTFRVSSLRVSRSALRASPVVPASNTFAIFGWSISASAWRSASKRAMTWRVS